MTPLPLVAAKFVPSLKTFSQEFHLRSHSTSPVEWLVGAMYFYANGGYEPISIAGRFQVFGLQKTESLAGFGQATIEVFENTKLTAGLRYKVDWQTVPWTMVTDPELTLPTDQSATKKNQRPPTRINDTRHQTTT